MSLYFFSFYILLFITLYLLCMIFCFCQKNMYFSLIIDIQCRVERVYEKQKRLTPMDVEQELDRQDAAYLLFYFEGM